MSSLLFNIQPKVEQFSETPCILKNFCINKKIAPSGEARCMRGKYTSAFNNLAKILNEKCK